jgi:hypothetical protein
MAMALESSLRQLLESQREQIVDFIEQHFIPENIPSEIAFQNIANELQKRFVLNHRGKIGLRDKAHGVLAMAIICSMWCGWLSQAKTNRNEYTQEWVDSFKKAITEAFEIGQKYSEVRP